MITDSADYLYTVFSPLRPSGYRFFAYYTGDIPGNVWTIVLAQSFGSVGLLYRLWCLFAGKDNLAGFLLSVMALIAFSSFSFFTSLIMPHIFYSWFAAAVLLLMLGENRFDRWLGAAVLLIVLPCHHSFLLLGITAVILSGMVFLFSSSFRKFLSRWTAAAVITAWAVLGVCALNAYVGKMFSLSYQGGGNQTLAKLYEMGLLLPYLEKECPENQLKMCGLQQILKEDEAAGKRTTANFLFNARFHLGELRSGWEDQAEQRYIAKQIFRSNPGLILKSSIKDSVTMFFTHQIISDYDKLLPYAVFVLRELYPKQMAAYIKSKQASGELGVSVFWGPAPAAYLMVCFFYAGLMVCLYRIKKFRCFWPALFIAFLTAVNAVIFGSTSSPGLFPYYQSRTDGIVFFFIVLMVVEVIRKDKTAAEH